jgi:pyruvate/2-oxoglutarate dehydrogenase complex dihydrolipoamide acyltransferase (E2) component
MSVEVRIEDAKPDEEVEVVAHHVKVGERVEAGQPLLEVATDKANMDLTAPVAGTVAEMMAEGALAGSDQVFAVIDDA